MDIKLVFCTLLLCCHIFTDCHGHGLLSFPIPRGATSGKSKFIPFPGDRSHKTDTRLHFPAGDKSSKPGAAVRSQMKNADKRGWILYSPFDPSFHWRYGVCGDLPNGNEHLKGGKFYNSGKTVATFKQGGTIAIEMTVVASHNGYIELYICDVNKCLNGEISPQCFLSTPSPCAQLKRTPNPKCDGRKSLSCGPIDKNYPGRWYLPCPSVKKGLPWYTFGNRNSILYQLPEKFSCDHCVLQFSWVSANFCNPPGYVDYFIGPDKPLWGTCRGQGGARGGVNKRLPLCGGKRFSEEYFMCSDVKIV